MGGALFLISSERVTVTCACHNDLTNEKTVSFSTIFCVIGVSTIFQS